MACLLDHYRDFNFIFPRKIRCFTFQNVYSDLSGAFSHHVSPEAWSKALGPAVRSISLPCGPAGWIAFPAGVPSPKASPLKTGFLSQPSQLPHRSPVAQGEPVQLYTAHIWCTVMHCLSLLMCSTNALHYMSMHVHTTTLCIQGN